MSDLTNVYKMLEELRTRVKRLEEAIKDREALKQTGLDETAKEIGKEAWKKL